MASQNHHLLNTNSSFIFFPNCLPSSSSPAETLVRLCFPSSSSPAETLVRLCFPSSSSPAKTLVRLCFCRSFLVLFNLGSTFFTLFTLFGHIKVLFVLSSTTVSS